MIDPNYDLLTFSSSSSDNTPEENKKHLFFPNTKFLLGKRDSYVYLFVINKKKGIRVFDFLDELKLDHSTLVNFWRNWGKIIMELVDQSESSPLVPPSVITDTREIDLEAGSSEQIQCRICLETDGRDFIAPCKCKGTSKFVHRECLDHWRAVKEGFAFSHCTTCKAPYYLRVHVPTDRKWRTLKFRFFVTRDILFIFLAVQLVIALLGYLVYLIDTRNKSWLRFTWGFDSELSFYYLCGALLFFALLGLSGCFITCYDRRVRNDLAQPCRELCLCCCHPGMCADCHLPGTLCMWTDCTTCFESCAGAASECGGCLGGAGEAGLPLVLIMALIVLGLFTVIGIFYSVLVATMVGQRIWQRHYHILAKRMLTKEYVVEDVDGEVNGNDWSPTALPPEHVQQLKSLGLM